jgi:hypothetical protein
VHCRSCPWQDALDLLEQAQAKEAAANSLSLQPTDAARSSRRSTSMSGFYITRYAFHGNKHFVMLVLERGAVASGSGTVIVVRPSTGRSVKFKPVRYLVLSSLRLFQYDHPAEMTLLLVGAQDIRERYRLVERVEDVHELWEALYEEGFQEDENGAQLRYNYHHLLTGSVLNVWSRIESHYAVLNGRMAPAVEGVTVKRYTMRVARATIGGAASEEAKSTDAQRAVGSPSYSTSVAVAGSLAVSPVPVLQAVQQEGERGDAARGDALNLVGIWIPQPRIKEVLALLRTQRTEMEKGEGAV